MKEKIITPWQKPKPPLWINLWQNVLLSKEMQVVWPWDFRKDRWVTPRLVI